MKKIFPIIACFLLVQLSCAQDASGEFDELMSSMFHENGPGAAALVLRDGEIVYRKAFGMANMELGVPMKPENVFRIGSITKQFTASAILKLQEEGKLNLDDDITKYVKDYPTQGNKISIKHLLTHTSGIKSYTSMSEWNAELRKKDFRPKELIDFFKEQPMDFKPGEEWRYNNSAYVILGYIIELVSDMSYGKYIETNFFKPLGMENSYYGSASRIIKDRAYGYNQVGGKYQNAEFLSMTQPYAAGSLLSTVDDLSKWYRAVMEDKVLSKASREEAHTSYTLNNGNKTGYGYGWSISKLKGSPMISHGGGINGFVTSSMYFPEEDVFLTILSNCNCNPPEDIARKMAAIAIGKPFPKFKRIDVEDSITDKYLGKYQLVPGFIISIFKDSDKMYAQATGQGRFEIFPYEKNKFSLVGVEAQLTFNSNENGEITSLTLHQGGDKEARKIE